MNKPVTVVIRASQIPLASKLGLANVLTLATVWKVRVNPRTVPDS